MSTEEWALYNAYSDKLIETPTQFLMPPEYWEELKELKKVSNMATPKAVNGWTTDDATGIQKHYMNGLLHAEEGPAEIREKKGTELYYRRGLLHRDGGKPAMISGGGSYKYAVNGKYHRDGDEPAIIWGKGGNHGYRQEWWVNGEVQKALRTDGSMVYFQPNCTKIASAILSRKDGPAVIHEDGKVEHWLNGTFFSTKTEWQKAVKVDDLRILSEKALDKDVEHEDETEVDLFAEDVQEEAPKTIKSGKKKKMSKPSIAEMMKTNATEAAYRVAATQATNAVKTGIVNVMRNKGAEGGTITAASEFLDGEFGKAMIGLMLGMGLQYIPNLSEDARVQKLAEEMRVGGMAVAGNAVIGEAVQHLIPALSQVLNNLPEVEQNSSVRVKDEKSLSSAMEEEEEDTTSNVAALRTAKS